MSEQQEKQNKLEIPIYTMVFALLAGQIGGCVYNDYTDKNVEHIDKLTQKIEAIERENKNLYIDLDRCKNVMYDEFMRKFTGRYE